MTDMNINSQNSKNWSIQKTIVTVVILLALFFCCLCSGLTFIVQNSNNSSISSRNAQEETVTPTQTPSLTPSTNVLVSPTVANNTNLNPTPTETKSNQNESYKVLEVVDGDTIKVEKYGTLRLIGIDTPETKDPRKPVQCYGIEASEKAKSLLQGKTVKLEFDSSQGELDKYGRTLAYVFLEDGTFFNLEMIKQGYAHEYTYNKKYKYQTSFKEAESKASSNQLGLWSNVCK
jgi:micrococcal nuclease